MAKTHYVCQCCNCGFDSLGVMDVCVNCGHYLCMHCDRVLTDAHEDKKMTSSKGETRRTRTAHTRSREAAVSSISGPSSDRTDIDNPTSSNSEATGAKHHELDERLGSRLANAFPARVQRVETQSSSPHEPQHIITPKEPRQEHTDNAPENFECREEEEEFENDSIYSEADTATDLESSSLTCGDEGSDTAAQRIPGGWEFEDTDERTATGEIAPLDVSPGGDLRLLPWILWSVLCIWRWLQKDWQDFCTASHQLGERPVTSIQSGLSTRQQNAPSGGKRRKERTDSADEAERDKTPAGKSKRVRRPEEPESSQPLACPFCKKDLQQYQACVKLKLTKVRYVKQHLHRKHRDDIEDWVMARLRLRSAPGTEEEQWYRIFDLLFPGHSPRPATPYNDFTVSERPQPSPDTSPAEEVLYVPDVFLTRHFVQSLEQSLVQDPALASVGADDIRRALARGLSRAHMEQTSHQNPSVGSWQARTQQSSEADIEDSEESSNSRGLVLEREVPNSHTSNDSAGTNEHPSSVTVHSDPTTNPQRSERGSSGTTEGEGLLYNSSMATGGASEDQQPSQNGDLRLGDGSTVDLLGTGSEWGNFFDTDCQDWWLDGWSAIDSDQSLGENSGGQA